MFSQLITSGLNVYHENAIKLLQIITELCTLSVIINNVRLSLHYK